MSKTTIKELALSLSEKHDLSKADAERFVATIFEVINDGLEEDKLVKVKGLGAFKIVGVAARKSVDVNTGEPIVIEGRNKISFTPDASMRDDVNKPFSQFETVVINDGVDFSSIDNEYGNGTDTTSENETETRPENIVDNAYKATEEGEPIEERFVDQKNEVDASSVEQIEENYKTQKEQLEKNVAEAKIANEETENEANTASEENVGEVSLVNEETVDEANIIDEETVHKANTPNEEALEDENIEEEKTVEKETEGKKNTEKEISIGKDTKENGVERKLINDEDNHHKHALKALMVTAVIIVIGCLCGGYYLFTQIQRRDSHIEMLEKQMRLVAQHQKKKNITVQINTQSEKANKNQDTIPTKADIKQEATKQLPQDDIEQETSQAENKEAALQNQYNKDARIRTGAYVIVGIKKTVTVRPGQTMDGISRLNLGPGMECYLEAVNGGKRELKAGESINIPQLKLKKRLR